MSHMTHDEIRAAITASPELLALVPDTVALSAALSEGRTKLGAVGRSDFAGWAATYGMRSKIQDFSSTASHPLRDSSLAILDVLQGASEGIDFTKPQNVAILDAWVAVGALSVNDKDVLLALATQPDPVTEYSVRCAIFADDGTLRV